MPPRYELDEEYIRGRIATYDGINHESEHHAGARQVTNNEWEELSEEHEGRAAAWG